MVCQGRSGDTSDPVNQAERGAAVDAVIAAIKGYCRRAHVEKVDAGPKGVVITFRDNKFAHPERLVYFIRQHGQAAKVRPDMKVVFLQVWKTAEERLMGTTEIMRQLANLAEDRKAA